MQSCVSGQPDCDGGDDPGDFGSDCFIPGQECRGESLGTETGVEEQEDCETVRPEIMRAVVFLY